MARTRRFHPLVAEDLGQALAHYDQISIDLGNRFRDLLRERLDSLTAYPESYACIHENTRAAMVHRFPYVLLFEMNENGVSILGLFHAASDQAGWFQRSMDQ